MIEKISYNDELLAIVVSKKFSGPGTHFFTEGDLSQQLAYMHHPKGKIIQPHVHTNGQINTVAEKIKNLLHSLEIS
jgi:hypothetical protein